MKDMPRLCGYVSDLPKLGDTNILRLEWIHQETKGKDIEEVTR